MMLRSPTTPPALAAITTFVCLAAASLADVPRQIHYQGKLRDAAGVAINASASLRFRLYDNPDGAGSPLFDEAHAGVVVSRGLFSVLIGSLTGGGIPDSALDAPAVYLGVAVDDGPELAPRTRIVSSPHAIKSRSSEQLVRPGTYHPAVSVAASGNVGIGTTSPEAAAALDVASTQGGFLLPRLTQAQRDAIASPPIGLQVFNTTTNCVNMWAGATWKQSCFECTTFSAPFAGNNGPICEGGTLSLTSSTVSGAAYAWTGPDGFASSEQNPSIPNAPAAASGPYSVTATLEGCTSSPVTTLAIVHPIPPQPTLGSNSPVCIGQTLTLTATPVPGGDYSWIGPNLFQSGMQSPTISNVTAAAAGNYELTVSANGCTAMPVQISVSTIDVPPLPGPISGPATFCENQPGAVYSIAAVAGASSYAWTAPSDAVITDGQGTTAITVAFGSASGDISVIADSACGSSAARTLSVVRLDPPATPGSISGEAAPCANSSGHVYSIAPVAGASSYAWSVPPDATINSGQGTPSITVSFAATSGAVIVAAENDCGASADQTLSVTLQSAGTGSQTFNATSTGRTGSIQTFVVPSCVTMLTIEAWGAQGGNQGGANRPSPTPGANGARMRGDFAVTPGATLNILVGQRGTTGGREGGGGGGTFVTDVANSPLIVAAGGGGSSEDSLGSGGATGTGGLNGLGSSGAIGGSAGSGGGAGNAGSGGGLLGDGSSGALPSSGGLSYLNGGTGGLGASAHGGYGGGGGARGDPGCGGGGGGGGYSGGGCGAGCHGGGGGGSFNAGANQNNSGDAWTGHGKAVISW